MYTNKDVEYRSIFVINCIENRSLRVSSGELLLENADLKKTLTKMPFQKILAILIIGNITITTPLIDKCKQYNVAIIVVKPNLRPVFWWSDSAEANFLLRKRQHEYPSDDLTIARHIVSNKIQNQFQLLRNTRITGSEIEAAKKACNDALSMLSGATDLNKLMGLEGFVSKHFFSFYFKDLDWQQRRPRVKCDVINTTLDIGYTLLFNYIETFTRMFGFDVYIGVYHRLWFKRKSLICDLMEPFRCIVDARVRKAFNTGECKKDDFEYIKGEYFLKREKNADYYKMFSDDFIKRKTDVFMFVREYYRCFMQQKKIELYPLFKV